MMFRIEKNGIGPYRHSSVFPDKKITTDLWMDNQHHAHQMDTPNQDEILGAIYTFLDETARKYPQDVLYCFESKDSFKNHFSELEMKKLSRLGFEIKEYSDKDYFIALRGKTQSIIFLTEESYTHYLNTIQSMANSGFVPMF